MLYKMVDGRGVGLLACTIILLCVFSGVNSYSKYGRNCEDIGCLPTEECVITSDSCSYNQRNGKDCGSYPTCKKKSGTSTSSSSSVPSKPSINPSGSIYNPGLPQGLQPVNPYNSPFVFGNQPYYSAPGGTGGPPGGYSGILSNSGGGGLAPYPGNYPNPNTYNYPKPPPQYQNQNQNLYNRQTQGHPSSATQLYSNKLTTTIIIIGNLCIFLFYLSNTFQYISNSTSHNNPSAPPVPSAPLPDFTVGGGGYNGEHGGGSTAGGGNRLYPNLPSGGSGGGSSYNPGGYVPPYGGRGGGYNPTPPPPPGYGGGHGGYSGGGSGSYVPTKPKEKDSGGFFSSFFSNPAVSQAVTGIIAGQIANSLRGGGGGATGGSGSHQPSGGYGSGGTPSSNILGGLLGNVLSGGGSGRPNSYGSSGSGGSSASNFLSSLLGGGGSGMSFGGGRSSSGSGGLGEIFSSRNFGGLFSENPSRAGSGKDSSSGSSVAATSSGGVKSYPTQPPPSYGNYNNMG